MKLLLPIILLILVPYGTRDATAQQVVPAFIPGGAYEAKANVVLRDSPPNEWFYFKGDQIGVINQGDKVIAVDQKVVSTMFTKYQWLKVQKLDVKTGKPTLTGWVYTGGAKTAPYFALEGELATHEKPIGEKK